MIYKNMATMLEMFPGAGDGAGDGAGAGAGKLSVTFAKAEEDAGGEQHDTSRRTRFSDGFDDHPRRSGLSSNRASLGASLSQRRSSSKHQGGLRGTIGAWVSYYLWSEEKEIKIYLFMIVIPCLFSVWYSTAMLFPPQARDHYSFFLWDDGKLLFDGDGRPAICPRPSICSEGILQIVLISIARVTAFASYVFMGITFLSKMHVTIHRLSTSYIRTFVPFESLHHFHTFSGKVFASLAVLHTISHYIRYIVRQEVDQLSTRVHISGLCSILAMITVVLCMSSIAKRFKDSIGKFEKRLNSHWLFIVLCVALCFHHVRTKIITLIFFGLWCLDYIYGQVFATYSLDVVELLPLPGDSGVQMLFRNPPGFNPKSGEYVKIQLPWLTHGGKEWHPFSVYLRESTQRGLRNVQGSISKHQAASSSATLDEPLGLSLDAFIRLVLLSDFVSEAIDAPSRLLVEEAREDLSNINRYPTTQVFMCPVGDWTKGLLKDIHEQKQLRACWVRGPYTSPYFVAREFSHLILTASGIGITPALGVMEQYPGFSRTKILVWSTRDANMLKFFAPLIKDAHLAVVFYTGKVKLRPEEVLKISSQGNIYIQQSRPESLPGTIGSIIVQFENFLNLTVAKSIEEVDTRNKASWCVFYCGGSARIKDDLSTFSRKSKVSFEYEMFDW